MRRTTALTAATALHSKKQGTFSTFLSFIPIERGNPCLVFPSSGSAKAQWLIPHHIVHPETEGSVANGKWSVVSIDGKAKRAHQFL